MAASCRLRLPAGFVGFRADLGAFLRERRKRTFGKQQTLADAIGIARPSLSAIENGRALPLPDTVDGFMRELDVTWDMILERGVTNRATLAEDRSPRAGQRLDLGGSLRAGRKREGLTLRQVAGSCGLSVAQLSRIERSQAGRSGAYEDFPDDLALPREYRRMRFKDPELHRLYLLG